jgi:hypothetical protein
VSSTIQITQRIQQSNLDRIEVVDDPDSSPTVVKEERKQRNVMDVDERKKKLNREIENILGHIKSGDEMPSAQ